MDDSFGALGFLGFCVCDRLGWGSILGCGFTDACGDVGVSGSGLAYGHGEGRESLVVDGGADVAVVYGEGCQVFFGDAVFVEFPNELSSVCVCDLEDCEASGVCEEGVLHGVGEVFESCEALGGEDE